MPAILDRFRMGGSKERRRFLRHDRELPLALYDGDRKALDEGPTVRNVSRDGFACETPANIRTGDTLFFQLRLPGRGMVSGTAQVRWSCAQPSGFSTHCGAQITSIHRRDARALRRFLEPSFFDFHSACDTLLTLAAVFVVLWIVKDMQESNPRLILDWTAKLVDWLPQALIISAAAFGIGLAFRR